MYWAGVQSDTPCVLRARLRRLRPRRPPRRRTRHPRHALPLGLAGLGGGALSQDLPVDQLLAALGLARPSCATRSTATGPTARSGSNTRTCPTCRSAPGRSGTSRTSSPSRARPAPAAYATLLRDSGRVLHEMDPGARVLLGGLFGRPLQIPPNTGSGDWLGRLYEAGNVKRHLRRRRPAPLRRRRGRDAGADRNPAAGDAPPPRRPHAALHDRDRLGLRQLRVALGARPAGPGAGAARGDVDARSSTAREWRIGGVWWFSWADLNDSCQFCDSAGLLTIDREAKPSWYLFNRWTGGDPDTVPRAGIDDAESATPSLSGLTARRLG